MPSFRTVVTSVARALPAGKLVRGILGQKSHHKETEFGITPWDDVRFEEESRFRPFELLPDAGMFFDAVGLETNRPTQIDHPSLAAPFVTIEVSSESERDEWTVGLVGHGFSVFVHVAPNVDWIDIIARLHDEEMVVAAGAVSPLNAKKYTISVTENTVTVWTFDGSHWEALLTGRMQPQWGIDLRLEAQLSTAHISYEGKFTRLRAGYFGYIGLRDPQIIRTSTGEPLCVGSRRLITATCAGPGFFQAAHWGVFSISMDDPTDLRLESHLFFRRDGMLVGDHAGFLMRMENGRFVLGVSSWGDFAENVHIRNAETEKNLLSGVHLLSSSKWELPTTFDCWDPSLLHHKGIWWLSFVECLTYKPRFIFRPVLAKSSNDGDWDSGLTRVGADELHEQTEGTLLTLLGDELYVLASDGDARDYPIYDLQMKRIDTLNAPYGSNIPHPLIIEAADTRMMLTFDGTGQDEKLLGYGTHGDFLVYRSVR